jgi:Uma2 family endonuclease
MWVMSQAAAATNRQFTVEELFDLPDDGKRYEIYDGDIYMVPPPNLGHQHVSKELQFALTRHIKQHDLGQLYDAPVALILGPVDYTEPDLIYVSRARQAVLTDRGIDGCPDLVVEILSPGTRTRDLDVKKRLYERVGIPHYWIVDPRDRFVMLHVLEGARYVIEREYGERDTLKTSLFPELQIDLAHVWRR